MPRPHPQCHTRASGHRVRVPISPEHRHRAHPLRQRTGAQRPHPRLRQGRNQPTSCAPNGRRSHRLPQPPTHRRRTSMVLHAQSTPARPTNRVKRRPSRPPGTQFQPHGNPPASPRTRTSTLLPRRKRVREQIQPAASFHVPRTTPSMNSATMSSENIRQLSLKHPIFGRLFKYAERISILLTTQSLRAQPDIVTETLSAPWAHFPTRVFCPDVRRRSDSSKARG